MMSFQVLRRFPLTFTKICNTQKIVFASTSNKLFNRNNEYCIDNICSAKKQLFRTLHLSANLMKKEKNKTGNKKEYASKKEMSELIDVSNLESMLHNVVEELKETFFKNLSLRTDTGAFDNLIVELEGDSYPLNELAQINHKTADLIVINMVNFPQALKSVLTTIISSGINVNPQQDGTMIYVKLPKVSREHREALSKNAKTLFNDSKIKLRNIQNGFIKKLAKMKDVASEDLLFNVQQQIMVMVKEVEAELEKLTKLKQDELLKNVK